MCQVASTVLVTSEQQEHLALVYRFRAGEKEEIGEASSVGESRTSCEQHYPFSVKTQHIT